MSIRSKLSGIIRSPITIDNYAEFYERPLEFYCHELKKTITISQSSKKCFFREHDPVIGFFEVTGNIVRLTDSHLITFGPREEARIVLHNILIVKWGCHEITPDLITQILDRCENPILPGDRDIKSFNTLAEKWKASGRDFSLLKRFEGLIRPQLLGRFLDKYEEQHSINASRILYDLGLTAGAIDAYGLPPPKLLERVLNRPFTVALLDIQKCKDILELQGKIPDPDDVICGKILRKIHGGICRKSWVGTPMWLVNKEIPEFHRYQTRLRDVFKVTVEMGLVYLEYPRRVEDETSVLINRLLRSHRYDNFIAFDPHGKVPDSSQEEAIRNSIGNDCRDFTTIVGNPGSGKSTIVAHIVYNLERKKVNYLLCAPTGRAMARLSRASGKVAFTIHRLLGKLKEKKYFKDKKQEVSSEGEIKFPVEVIIFDEGSMITLEIFHQLMKRLRMHPDQHSLVPQIIMIGDQEQLQPVGWGSLLQQCLAAGVPNYTLAYNHRTNNRLIESNLSRMKNWGDDMGFFNFETDETFQIIEGDIDMVKKLVGDLLQEGKEPRIVPGDILILSPENGYLPQLNKICQDIYGQDKPEVLDVHGNRWVEGDRVMQTKNNYDIKRMNGDEGTIVQVSKDKIIVRFTEPDQDVPYALPKPGEEKWKKDKQIKAYEGFEEGKADPRDKLLHVGNLVQAHALSIHKSQGGQSRVIILFIPESSLNNRGLCNKNLLYTGISRAQERVYFVGNREIIETIAIQEPCVRYERLTERIVGGTGTPPEEETELDLLEDDPEGYDEDWE